MDYLPIFLNLLGRRCLLVGGGEAAAAKAALLRRAGAEVAVVARRLCPDLAAAIRAGAAIHLADAFSAPLLDGVALVMVAGASPAVGEAVSCAAWARALPVNVMDEPKLCSFIMPAIVDRSPVVVAVATGGAAPLLASLLRRWLERVLPERLGALAALAGRFRPLVKRRLGDGAARRQFWERIFTGEVAARALAGDKGAAAALMGELDAVQVEMSRRDAAA
jgi:uroporphyrin-III C-methyltransferase / precorrin-2 dehydrogenase / sirohydrochlorin ferrochelatase